MLRKINDKVVWQGKWLKCIERFYQTESGESFVWEMIERKNRAPGVAIVSRLMPSGRFVLIKQYRPAINAYVIAFPAGLCAQDDPAAEALKELREETGFTGQVKDISPVLKSQVGILDDESRIAIVEIDEYDPVNLNPCQKLEAGEEIEVFLVHPSEAKDFLKRQIEKGICVNAGVWSFFFVPR